MRVILRSVPNIAAIPPTARPGLPGATARRDGAVSIDPLHRPF